MKNIASIIIIVSIGILSCTSEKKEIPKIDSKKDELKEKKTIPVKIVRTKVNTNDEIIEQREQLEIDTTNTFIVDDFPVSDQLFKGKYELIKSGELISHDKAWFTNKELNQTIIFELYTDYHRLITYHFDNFNIPSELIERIELHVDGGEIASSETKEKGFAGLIDKSTEIETKKFTSNKGIYLGVSKEDVIKIYGKPDKRRTEEGLEILEWYFEGDEMYEGKFEDSKKQIARYSFGHRITLYFKKGKLISQILFNDIP